MRFAALLLLAVVIIGTGLVAGSTEIGMATPFGPRFLSAALNFSAMEQRVTIEAIDAARTRMSIENVFPDVAAMEQVMAMGMEQGLTEAVGQIDAILAENAVANP